MAVTIRAAARPRLWIVAGPNGSGKSSAYDRSDVDEFGGSVWIINPDLLIVRIHDVEGVTQTRANLLAVQRIEHWLDASIDTHQTIGVETVLSSPKYRRVVEHARRMQFEIRLIYVFLRSSELQMQRIEWRVAKGGHAVPEEKVRSRRQRSFEQLPWFFAQADQAWLFDNSGEEPRLVGRKDGDAVTLSDRLIPELMERLTRQQG